MREARATSTRRRERGRQNSESGEVAKTEPPVDFCVNRFSSPALRKSNWLPNAPLMASMLVERSVPSPKNLSDCVKSVKPTEMGRSFMYGSVKENCTDFCRLPKANWNASDSPRPSRLFVE